MKTPEYSWAQESSPFPSPRPQTTLELSVTAKGECPSENSPSGVTLLDLTDGKKSSSTDAHSHLVPEFKCENTNCLETIKPGCKHTLAVQLLPDSIVVAPEDMPCNTQMIDVPVDVKVSVHCTAVSNCMGKKSETTEEKEKQAGQSGNSTSDNVVAETLKGFSPRHKRKKPRCLYDEWQMAKAVQMVEEGSSIMAAAKHYSIPRATLWCRMKRDYPCAKLQTGPPSALVEDEEEAVCQWVAAMTSIGKPHTFKGLGLVVKEVLDSAGRRNVFSNNRPSEGWIGKFKKKHRQLFCKKPEATTLRGNITTDDVHKFFQELDSHLQSEGLDSASFLTAEFGHRVFNVDESGVYIPNDDCLSKLVMRRSERCNLQGCGDMRQMVTVVSCGSAAGSYLRPLLLFKEPRIPFKSGCPGVDNCSFNVGVSELGWMDHKAFLYWLQHFEDQLNELNVEKPVLLILDGHSPHVSVTALEYARECGVILHQIPPHTSHLLQPVYLALYRELKKSYREVVVEKWPKDDKVLSKKQFPAVFMEAWRRCVDSERLLHSYREAGIVPRNTAIVTNKLVKDEQVSIAIGCRDRTSSDSASAHPPALNNTSNTASSSAISVSSLQALLSSKVEHNLASSTAADSPDFVRGLQDVIDVVKEYIPKQVSEIYEKWIEERNTTCTSDTLYHIWLCLHNRITQHIDGNGRHSDEKGNLGYSAIVDACGQKNMSVIRDNENRTCVNVSNSISNVTCVDLHAASPLERNVCNSVLSFNPTANGSVFSAHQSRNDNRCMGSSVCGESSRDYLGFAVNSAMQQHQEERVQQHECVCPRAPTYPTQTSDQYGRGVIASRNQASNVGLGMLTTADNLN